MSWLSRESVLLAKNWDTVKDILEAAQDFENELAAFLVSLEAKLAQLPWWRNGWLFVEHQNNQVYIANRNWHTGAEHLIWIGVEEFGAANVFGSAPPPQLYVWVGKAHKDFGQVLVQWIAESDREQLGEVDLAANGYAIRGSVRKCLSEAEIETFDSAIREQILAFLEHYARILWGFDARIRNYLAGLDDA